MTEEIIINEITGKEEEEDFTHAMFVDEGHILFIPEIDMPGVEEEVFN